ncbi:hypothetical protein [Neoroseomonas oryzicola]|uniref:Uncharacterized protein n=1 Tax=Neoroseomonas oryzicola TaxID=535904 RepID=A0A9X9WPV9_9PROT|nr:hypothetical protein [Neoroseomonas oryzicola]MBR0662369.1 hypothetical protein [Neoroseomonas oryzicola]NKE16118.1 hypothetical protein [Neoroseomonas oryzicola]
MTQTPTGDPDREARARMLARMEELQRLHLALVEESRGLKRFTTEGRARAEIEIATEMLEGYLAATAAFLENMRGRYEARLPLLRRGEPAFGARPDQAPEHGAFWLAFSRLCAVLRRAERQSSG